MRLLPRSEPRLWRTFMRAPTRLLGVERLRLALSPLEADREPASPPVGLALRTLARVAANIAEHEPRQAEESNPSGVAEVLAAEALSSRLPRAPRDEPESRAVGGRLRTDLFVAAGIALFACGILFSAISKVRAQNQMLACQNNSPHDPHRPRRLRRTRIRAAIRR